MTKIGFQVGAVNYFFQIFQWLTTLIIPCENLFNQLPSWQMQKTVALHTLGCRLNNSETATIAQGMVDRGYCIVPFGQTADVVFINTCTVTDQADSTCRNLIRKALRSSPEGKIVVAGCYAQMEARKIQAIEGVDLILGNDEKYRVFDYLKEESQNIVQIERSQKFWPAQTTTVGHHTRGFLKIQDGCNYVCSFCIIPFARGRSKAIPISQAIQQAQALVQQGFKEIVLTGVNLGEYEARSGERLDHLLRELAAVEGLQRIRLSSVEPNTITDKLLSTWASSPKFLPHFHLPLQSGDDGILRAMKRKYDTCDYRRIVAQITSHFPECAIGADIIAGFPGESEEQFQNTVQFLRELPITHFHVFPYSKRKQTVAAKMADHLPYPIKKRRVKELIALGEEKLQQFVGRQIGKKTQVLFEQLDHQGQWVGYSENFIKVRVPSKHDLKNQIHGLVPSKQQGVELYGQI